SRRDLSNRDLERWVEGWLVDRIVRAFNGDQPVANVAARDLARRALWRDPIGVTLVAGRTYLAFFGIGWDVPKQLIEDEGDVRSFSPEGRVLMQERFGIDGGPDYQSRRTVLKSYHFAARPWYICLTATPFVLLAATVRCRPEHRALVMFIAL